MAEAITGTNSIRPFRLAKQKASAEIHNFYYPKKQQQKRFQKKRLESISEVSSSVSLVSDDKNNTRSSEAEQISIIFDGLNIDDNNHQSNNQSPTDTVKVALIAHPFDSVNMNVSSLLLDQNLGENLDDSIVLIEPKIEVIDLLEDSFEETISSLNFSALSTDDSTDEECECPKQVNPKIPWSSRDNVKSVVIQQEYIKQKFVDTLFGGNPMAVDLYEIFPDIEPELTLRRRSSVHWTTPPRYSMLPKY